MSARTTSVRASPACVEAQGSITRLSNTTQYSDGDTISDHGTTPTTGGYFTFTFEGLIPGGGLLLTDFTLLSSVNTETDAAFDLLLFTTLPALANFADNVQSAISDAEMEHCKGRVRFTEDGWSNLVLSKFQHQPHNVAIVCAESVIKVYGILVAQDTYTPASGEVLTVTAKGVRD